MSTAFASTVKAMSENPELQAKISSAGSAEERASILRAAGVEVPTHADVNAHLAKMNDVAGGGMAATTTAVAVAFAPVAAAGAAAAAA